MRGRARASRAGGRGRWRHGTSRGSAARHGQRGLFRGIDRSRWMPVAGLVLLSCGPVTAVGAAPMAGPAGEARRVAVAAPQPVAERLAEAERRFDAVDYEGAIALLDGVLAELAGRDPREPAGREMRAAAHALRARARYGIDDLDGARADLVEVLRIRPEFRFPEGVSPRMVALLGEVRAERIGFVRVVVDPPQAEVTIDGETVAAEEPVATPVGERLVRARLPGYTSVEQRVNVRAGATHGVLFRLVRLGSALSIFTVPADVEVRVDGVPRGRTAAAGPGRGEVAALASELGVEADTVGGPLVIDGPDVGTLNLSFTRPCYRQVDRAYAFTRAADERLVVRLEPAVGTIVVSGPAGATVAIDGTPRGTVPVVVEGLCEGPHVVEIVDAAGRRQRREVRLAAGERLAVAFEDGGQARP